MTTLTLKNGILILKTPYDAGLVQAIKSEIPLHGRAWNPSEKTWEVAYMYGHDVVKIVKQHLNTDLTIPKQVTQAQPETETRLLRVEYIGAAKERENGDISAMGYCNGNWSIIFPESVLKAWFFEPNSKPGNKPSLFAVLGVKQSANDTDIKKAYRIAAKTWHPDINDDPGAPEQFRIIQHAYEVLSNDQQRRKYLAGLMLQQDALKQTDASQYKDDVYRPPKRCGLLTCEGQAILNRFLVKHILFWDEITNHAGQVMVSYWPKHGDMFEVDWI